MAFGKTYTANIRGAYAFLAGGGIFERIINIAFNTYIIKYIKYRGFPAWRLLFLNGQTDRLPVCFVIIFL